MFTESVSHHGDIFIPERTTSAMSSRMLNKTVLQLIRSLLIHLSGNGPNKVLTRGHPASLDSVSSCDLHLKHQEEAR